ncbi:hypothetical protein [Streptomyces sp. NPDC096152]|uniref:hypothetical protein n=1 Tax=Streptomyces sp. NPDC096152 TaxID=3366078 RepID=UPI0037F65879
MRHRDDARPGAADRTGTAGAAGATSPTGTRTGGPALHDRHWARDVRGSTGCAAALLALLLLLDWASGSLTWWHAALWGALAVLLFLVLCPARVSAGEGWLASRSLLCERAVRTDLLVSVRCPDGVCRRVVLRDALGGRVEMDPEVLVDNPDLWYRLDADARTSPVRGSPPYDPDGLRSLAERVERETALSVFRISGLE